ncbi:MAG: bile acid:sodium symporter [Spirochaetales bacterium]
MPRFLYRHWFVLALAALLVGSFLLPGFGDTINPGGVTQNVLVFVFFLMNGFSLPSEHILHGLKNVKLHVAVQLFIFAVIPLYFAITAPLFSSYLGGNLTVGLYALAVLPTTMSTANIFTQTTGGNVVATMFNSALSNGAGIIVSPLLLSLFLATGGAGLPPEEIMSVFSELALIMLVPFAVGQLWRRRAMELAARVKKRLSTISSVIILTIIFMTVSSTAGDPQFVERMVELPVPFLFLALTHVMLLVLSAVLGRVLKLSRPDRLTLLFCAPQKTLAMGVPLLSVYFSSRPDILAFAILPLLFYHPFQIFTAGVVRALISPRREAETTHAL